MYIKSAKGGMQQIVLDLMIGLNKLKWTCILIAYSDCELSKLFKKHNIKVIELDKPSSILGYARFLVKNYQIIRLYKRSLIITNDIFTHIILSIYPFHKKEVFVSHGGDYKSKGTEFASRTGLSAKIAKYYSFKRVSRFIAVSDTQRKFLIDNAYVSSNKVTVIFNGFNNHNIKLDHTSNFEKNVRISVIGYIKMLKNQHVLFPAIKLLRDQGYPCSLNLFGAIADEKYYNELISLSHNLDIEDSIKFYGYTTNKDFIYNNSDIVVSCSVQEGFGLSIIEAMAYNIPTIASALAAGPANIITNLQTGILVSDNEPEHYADAIKKYIVNKDFKETVVNNASVLFKAKFSIEMMVRQYNDFLKDI